MAPLRKVLARLGEQGEVPEHEIPTRLERWADEFAAARERLERRTNDPPEAEAARRSISAHTRDSRRANIGPPLAIDATCQPWPIARADALVAINMIHIAPWSAALGLMAGAGKVLPPGGVLYLYGPFRENGMHTAPSNAAFDASLRARNPDWGVRDAGENGVPGVTATGPILNFLPIILIGVLFFYTARDIDAIEDVSTAPDTTIQIVGKQWSWDFNYLDEDVYETGVQAQDVGSPDSFTAQDEQRNPTGSPRTHGNRVAEGTAWAMRTTSRFGSSSGETHAGGGLVVTSTAQPLDAPAASTAGRTYAASRFTAGSPAA